MFIVKCHWGIRIGTNNHSTKVKKIKKTKRSKILKIQQRNNKEIWLSHERKKLEKSIDMSKQTSQYKVYNLQPKLI